MTKISYHVFFRNITILSRFRHVGFTIVSEQCSQTNVPIIKTRPFQVTNIKNNDGYLGQSG